MALHIPQALPSELGPALQTHLREHFGVHATMHPHGAPMAAPMYLRPRTEPGIWFHRLTPLATIHGAIIATGASTTPAGMRMALAYEHAPGLYTTMTTSGVGTSQEGEALTTGRLLGGTGLGISTLRTYEEGAQRGDGIHHLYARTLGAERPAPTAAVNIVVTPSHWITTINVRLDAATREEPHANLTWMLHRLCACLPQVKSQDHYQLAPIDLQEWLQEQAAIPAWVHYEHRWGPNYRPSLGLSWTGPPVTSSSTLWPTACATCPP